MSSPSISFEPMNADTLARILGITIKHDHTNKLVTFLCALSAYTEDPFNISFNAPSSTGKSYIPIEIAKLFPKHDVVQLGYCSPTAFFHDVGEPDKEKKGRIVVDFSRKILIFLDQPHNELLSRLRPLLSHDSKTINIKITDKSQKQGLRTKDVLLKGFPAVIHSSAGMVTNEQEATRMFLLSPEISQMKIRKSISETIIREMDGAWYEERLKNNELRATLTMRIHAIKAAHIKNIKIAPALKKEIHKVFLSDNAQLRPRSQRDIKRFISLMKAFALLNFWWRKHECTTITVHHDDFNEALAIWEELAPAQDLNIPPYVHQLYRDVILPAWQDKQKAYNGRTIGLTRGEVLGEHYRVYGRMLDAIQFRQQILPMLETSGLVVEERDPHNKRRKYIYPATTDMRVNSVRRGGVPAITD